MGIQRRHGWARSMVVAVGLAVAVAGLGVASPAAAATPGCTVSDAAPMELGAVNTHGTTCSTRNSYSYVDLGAGDVLTLSLDGRDIKSTAWLGLYNPGVTDFTIGAAQYTDSTNVYVNQMTQVGWRAYEPGRFVIRWSGGLGLRFTPSVARVPRQAGRVTGGCRIESAPVAPAGVTQYAASGSCSNYRYWRIPVKTGQRLNFTVASYRNSSWIGVYLPGVTDYTLGQTSTWCADSFSGSAAVACGAVPKTGAYVIRTSGRMSFTPKVVNPPQKRAKVRVWSYKKASRLEADVDPNVGWEWKVRLQKRVGSSWVNASTVKVTKKTHRKFNPKKGTYRVVVYGKNGYASATSRSVYIRK